MINNLCSPALIYLIFSMTQVVIDSIKGLYNVALMKGVMMILFTLLLNILCQRGLGVVSWIIVFIPFMLMSLITTILLFVFGLDPSKGLVVLPASHQKGNILPNTETNQNTKYKNKQLRGKSVLDQNKPSVSASGKKSKSAHDDYSLSGYEASLKAAASGIDNTMTSGMSKLSKMVSKGRETMNMNY